METAVASMAAVCLLAAGTLLGGQEEQKPLFRGGVDVVSVSATVTDARGRFVKGLSKEDFILLEDGRERAIEQFSAERVPVSLGIVLDASDSMEGERMSQARGALKQLLDRLPDPEDEIFLYTFSEEPELVQPWTTDRELVRRALGRVDPSGRTALYDAVSKAVEMANSGRHPKKALIIISDGNDTASRTAVDTVKRQIRESELLVYAIGVDGRSIFDSGRRRVPFFQRQFPPWQRPPIRRPGIPGGRTPPGGGRDPMPVPPAPRPSSPNVSSDPVDAMALRSLTDDSGGRTEIIRSAGDLGDATAAIADELARQYYLAYASAAPRDHAWHTIDVDVRREGLIVRARRGFIAQ